MSRSYYRLWYRLDDTDKYLIWFSNADEGLVTQPNRVIPCFDDQEALRAYAERHQIVLEAMEPLLHDLDVIARWLGPSLTADIDCDAVLTAWNLFDDLATSVNADFDPDHTRTNHVYDKLFWGNNLPAVTPPGQHYTPRWSDDELVLMREILHDGLVLFRKHVKVQ